MHVYFFYSALLHMESYTGLAQKKFLLVSYISNTNACIFCISTATHSVWLDSNSIGISLKEHLFLNRQINILQLPQS